MLKTFDFNKMPIVESVNEIMVDAAKRGASDIHFDPLENIMKIRIRIDGVLIDYALVPNDIKKNLITRIKIIAGMNITESRLPQDGAIKATVQGTNLDLRVSTIPTNMGEKIVIRILDYSLSGAGIENLGFSDKNYKKVIEMINQPNGIILVTGATGTGKSTTVYSVLQRLNKEATNIITVEDPVEMNIEGVNQIQANSEIGLDFATALRSILRQDPDIIMIGEIRDTETAKIAIRASITGHLVLSTLHTNDSLNTIERLLDMDVERYLLASSLSGIISQRLARRLCPHCRIERKVNKYEEKLFQASLGHKVKKLYSANPAGCEHCHGGFAGRIAIQEVLLINQQIRDAISLNVNKEELRDLVYNSSDVDSLLQDGLMKVEQGITSMEELLKLIELENEDSTIAKMGLEAATNLGQELEEVTIEDEIKAKPITNIEVAEETKQNNKKENEDINKNEKTEDIVIKQDNNENTIDNELAIDELLNDIKVNDDEANDKIKKDDKDTEETKEIVEEEKEESHGFFKKNKKKKEDEKVEEEDNSKEDEIINFDDDLNIGEVKNNNELKFDDDLTFDNDINLNNDLNLDELSFDNSPNINNDLNLDELNFDDDLKLNNDLNLDELKFDNNDLNLDNNNNKEANIINNESDIEEKGKLDDDLSNASDDDIMNMFN